MTDAHRALIGALNSIDRAAYRTREWAAMEGPYTEIIKEAAIIRGRVEKILLALAALPPEQDGAKTMREALEECVAMIRQLRLEVPTKAVAALAHSRQAPHGGTDDN